jgi:hypothetical protein
LDARVEPGHDGLSFMNEACKFGSCWVQARNGKVTGVRSLYLMKQTFLGTGRGVQGLRVHPSPHKEFEAFRLVMLPSRAAAQ